MNGPLRIASWVDNPQLMADDPMDDTTFFGAMENAERDEQALIPWIAQCVAKEFVEGDEEGGEDDEEKPRLKQIAVIAPEEDVAVEIEETLGLSRTIRAMLFSYNEGDDELEGDDEPPIDTFLLFMDMVGGPLPQAHSLKNRMESAMEQMKQDFRPVRRYVTRRRREVEIQAFVHFDERIGREKSLEILRDQVFRRGSFELDTRKFSDDVFERGMRIFAHEGFHSATLSFDDPEGWMFVRGTYGVPRALRAPPSSPASSPARSE